MVVTKALGYYTLLVLLLLSCSGYGQRRSQQTDKESCRDFVRAFYDWYVPVATKANQVPAWDLALKGKRQVFSPELYRQLDADSRAQKQSGADLVGLDFDPFLNCQDCGERYVVDEITFREGKYFVEVSGVFSGKKNDKPDVMPELILRDGKWLFVNFHYPNPSSPEFENLLSQLKTLRELRQSPHK